MKITPETYEKMNAPPYSVPPQVDMVSKQWEKLGVFSIEEREQYRKNNSGL